MKRRSRNHGRRLLALALTLVMCLSLLNITALAVENEQDPGDTGESEALTPEELQQAKQIVDGWLKAGDGQLTSDIVEAPNGEWNTTDGGKVSVSKTIAPTGKENDFEVTLTVKTKQDLQEINYYPDAAVTLVIDVSASMSQCAICGKNYHDAHGFIDDGPQEDDAFEGAAPTDNK